jgi:hypothetical protein
MDGSSVKFVMPRHCARIRQPRSLRNMPGAADPDVLMPAAVNAPPDAGLSRGEGSIFRLHQVGIVRPAHEWYSGKAGSVGFSW